MNLIDENYKREFYIFFFNIKEFRWWKLFLSKEINHCAVVEVKRYDDINVYLRIENLNNLIYSEFYFGDVGDKVFKKTIESDELKKCLYYKTTLNPEKRFVSFFRFQCVTFTKKILNINKYFIFTPNQLYKYLLKYGAKEIK